MFAPHTVTIYNAGRVVDGRPVFQITVLAGVFLDIGRGANTLGRKSDLRKSGLVPCEDAVLFIPFACKAVNGVSGAAQSFVPPKVFDRLEEQDRFWTIGPRGSLSGADCFFVKGCVVEPDMDFRELCRRAEFVFRVSSVRVRDFGSAAMRHWQAGGVAGA